MVPRREFTKRPRLPSRATTPEKRALTTHTAENSRIGAAPRRVDLIEGYTAGKRTATGRLGIFLGSIQTRPSALPGYRRPDSHMHTDTMGTLRWIERARGHIAELGRDPRQLECMAMAAEVERAVQAAQMALRDTSTRADPVRSSTTPIRER